jgi:hypothetical protein
MLSVFTHSGFAHSKLIISYRSIDNNLNFNMGPADLQVFVWLADEYRPGLDCCNEQTIH